MKQFVIINGTGGSGKDTFVDFCRKYAKVFNFSTVDKVKEIAKIIGWDGVSKTEKDRKFLSDLKQLTTEYNNMPLLDLMEKANAFRGSDDEIMFIHIREPENIKAAVEALGGAKTLLIKREGLSNISSNRSDSEVDNYPYDDRITNTTLEELDVQARQYVSTLRGEKRWLIEPLG